MPTGFLVLRPCTLIIYIVMLLKCGITISWVYLVYVVFRNDIIKQGVEVVQQVDNLQRSTLCRQWREANNIREINGNFVKTLRLNSSTFLQFLCNRSIRKQQVQLHVCKFTTLTYKRGIVYSILLWFCDKWTEIWNYYSWKTFQSSGSLCRSSRPQRRKLHT